MNRVAPKLAALTLMAVCASVAPSVLAAETAEVECKMDFSLKGWSAFYKTAKGEGTIKCSNGQTMAVELKSEGGGLTFGKSEIKNGTGKFSSVAAIGDLLGSYAEAQAHAGAVKSSSARVLTKGEVSLALAGTGDGVDLGIDFGKFTISKAGSEPKK
jgi:hypothetical protein